MARKRASMREGPLAELFRATEAAQRKAGRQAESTQPEGPPAEPSEETVPHVPEFARNPVSERPSWEEAAQPAPRRVEPEPAPEPPRPATPVEQPRVLAPVPEPPPRLERAPRTDTGAYLAVIRVVGVGGAGLRTRAWRRCALPATRSSSSPTSGCSRCSTARRRCWTPSGWRTTSCG